MLLQNSFTIPLPLEEAWQLFQDIERVAPCLPGATLEASDETGYAGSVTVRLGPMRLTYGGRAEFVELDDAAKRAVLKASGTERRGSGTAGVLITAELRPAGTGTQVSLSTDLSITGRPAQFGRGILADVSMSLTEQFATRLAAAALAENGAQPTPAPASRPAEEATPAPAAAPDASLDLLPMVGWPLVKRVAPLLLGAILLGAILARSLRTHRRQLVAVTRPGCRR